ncbi:choline BCCT transporter BetT [Neptunicella sp.]|uniref:choline BCCT transporter BetT n=1 Tax=Neptunicella sp. TaxID=2125986 RepID=UPI003F694525
MQSSVVKTSKAKLNPAVFYPAAMIIFLLSLFAALFPHTAKSLFATIQATIISNASWFYVLSVAIILVSVVYLGISRYGEIKLGPDHSTPKYNQLTWLSMLFSAGMGIGLMFFGVAEPVMHFLSPPTADPATLEAARQAMLMTFFHWGLHAWGIYAVVALMLAFFAYRHNLPLTLRSALYPLIGEKIYGPIGHMVDIFAVIGTVFGVATSLGFGAAQVNSGLHYLYNLPININMQIMIVILISLMAVASVASGLDKGVRRLSELNMVLAAALVLLILALGSTVFLLEAFVQNTGAYLSNLVSNTFNLFAYDKTDWIGGWTIFYWGWWLAWAPFVGLFIAKISRGRTIREFILGVLLVPTTFTLLWMTVFGNSAIELIFNQGFTELGQAVQNDTASALFHFLEYFPMASFLSGIAILMVMVFFVTSADSGSLVVDMLCSNGETNTPVWQRIFWASIAGIVAIALMLADGLEALQTMTIASALPFTLVLMLGLVGLFKALRIDVFKRNSLSATSVAHGMAVTTQDWRKRLNNIVDFPAHNAVKEFIQHTVQAALRDVASELEKKGLTVEVNMPDEQSCVLQVMHGDEIDFTYGVYCQQHLQPDYINPDDNADVNSKYYRAEVHLREGGQDYDLMGWSKIEVINDILEQYQKHLHFLHLLR